MGVLGLWQLLAPVGQPVTLESLENKIFAVDISIWLNQAVKGYRDSQGGSVPNAHLLSLFSRLCKLLFYKIRPIIVFDGGFPELKKQTIINRQQRRAAAKQNSREVGLKILTNYLASQKLGSTDLLKFNKSNFKVKEKPRDEIFKLPPLPESSQTSIFGNESSEDYESKFTNFSREDIKYLNQIDIESDDFNNLPPDVKQEILSTLKESRKHRTWDQYEELPKESNDFSNYQMQCLLKRRKLQSKLEEVQKDIRQINSSAYVSQYTSDHVIGETNKIMSDDTSYYVLLKKIVEQKGSNSDIKESPEVMPSTSVMVDTKSVFIKDLERIDVDGDEEVFSNMKTDNFKPDLAKVKVEKQSLNLSDEEYDIDNPPPNDILKEKNTQRIDLVVNQNLGDEKNLFPSSSDQVPSFQQVTASSSVAEAEILHKSESQKGLILSESDESETEILNVEQSASTLNKTIILSEDENKSTNKAIVNNDTLNEKTLKQNECNSVNKNETSIHTSLNDTVEKGVYDSSIPEKIRDNSEDKNFHASPSTSKQEVDFSTEVISEKVHEKNLELKRNLEAAASILEREQAKQERQSNTVQDHMIEECKELLQLFGIPFVVSPLEAEAQCAFYDSVDITHGTITDDSDVWLFGGKRVFKNFFTQQKFVESFKDKEIFNHFGLSRMKLISFALLTGSDYTEGIEGVGPVTAMEIISEFPGEGIDALQKFKEWWDDCNKHAKPPENKVRAKLQKLVLSHNFPDEKVYDAYINPEVDTSMEKFSWGRPDLDALREYCKERFAWNQSKVDDALLPILKKLNEQDKQTHLDSFFTVSLKKDTNLFPSKRIMSALKKITSPNKSQPESKTNTKTTKRKSGTSIKKVIPRKKTVSTGTNVKKNMKFQGPNLSEESSSNSD